MARLTLAQQAHRADIHAGAGRAYEATAGSIEPEHWAQAEDEMLADADGFCDWLGAECMGHGAVSAGYVPKGDALVDHATRLTVPQLVALSLYPRAECAAASMNVLRERYLQASQAWLLKRAGEIARDAIPVGEVVESDFGVLAGVL